MIRLLLDIYAFIIILQIILSYVPAFRDQIWMFWLRKVCNFTQDPIRKILPPDLPFDFSAVVVVLIINIIKMLW
ncbi:MAG: YggT family protein [Bacteriovoracaceae bacterium]|nr:YggT family protein [Bacteriovoracaceae bacterium]